MTVEGTRLKEKGESFWVQGSEVLGSGFGGSEVLGSQVGLGLRATGRVQRLSDRSYLLLVN